MPRANLVKSAFTSGVLDPRLFSRVDIAHYERGLQQGTNCIITPFGNLQRRGGLRRINILTGAAPGVIGTRLIPFSYNSNTDQYLLAFVYNAAFGGAIIQFYKNDSQIANINGTGNGYMASPWLHTEFAALRFAQTADVMVVTHENYAPRTIVRGAADNLWTIATPTFAPIPQIDYNDAASPVPTSEVQTITFAGVPVVGNTYKLDLEGVLTEAITWAGDATADDQAANNQRISKALAKLYVTGPGDIVVARTGALVYTVTFQNGSARSYKLMTGFSITGPITLAIVKTTNGVPRTEPLWSAGRGYPRHVCFWENRMVLAGFKSKPQTVGMSVINDPYNFNTGEGLDDDAILRTLETDQQNKIVALVPSKHLQVFTEGAEFYFPDQPVTPGASGVIPQTAYGCSAVRPVVLDGATLFLEEKGRGLRQFLFSQLEEAYQGPSASRLSSHLLNAPVDMAACQSSEDDTGSFLYVVNADGTAAAMMSERSEEILAWTPFTTLGQVKNVAVLTDQVYFIVRYNGGGAGLDRYSLVKLDSDYYMDDSNQFTQAATVTWNLSELAAFAGQSIQVRGDGQALPDEIVAGQIITLDNPVSTLQWGLAFAPIIKPMPAALVTQNFQGVNRQERLCRVRVNIMSTLGLMCDGEPMDDRFLDVTPLDTAPTALSGVVEWTLAEWGENLAPTLTQDGPLPLTLRSLEFEVEMH